MIKSQSQIFFFAALMIFISCFSTAFAPSPKVEASNEVEWLSIEEVQKRMKKKPKKIVVDVYTDWCGWCKKMDKATFSTPEVSKQLTDKFYAVKFNAEQTENIIFNNKVYGYNSRSKTHDLAIELLNGRLGYPTVVYLNEKLEVIQSVPGYYEKGDYLKILDFISTEAYKKQNLEQFMRSKS